MEKKDLLNAEIQILSIAVTVILASSAGIGFILYSPDFYNNILSQCLLVIVGLTTVISIIWAVNTYLKIKDLIK